MDNKLFRRLVSDTLIANNFTKRKSYYYLESEDLIIIIGIQKSSYSNSYYINIGYIIKQLASTTDSLREEDGHLRIRVSYYNDLGKETDGFDLEQLGEPDIESIKSILQKNICKYISNVQSIQQLVKLLEVYPNFTYWLTIKAKKFLEALI